MSIYKVFQLKYISKAVVKFFLGLFIAVVSFVIILSKTDFSSIFNTLKLVNVKLLLFATSFILIGLLLKTIRWHFLLKFLGKFSLKDVFISFSIGNMVNMLLPFRSGELARVFLLSKKNKISKASLLGTVFYEHILDFLALFPFLCLAFLFYSFPISQWIKITVFFLTLGVTIYLLSIVVFRNKISILSKQVIDAKAEKIYTNVFTKSFYYFVSFIFLNVTLYYPPREFFKIAGFTALIWSMNSCWLYFLFISLDPSFNYAFGIGEISVLILTMTLAIMIPSAPSYAGTLHLATLIALQPTDIPVNVIVAYSTLIHSTGTIIAISVGFISWIANYISRFKENENLMKVAS